MQTFEMFDTVDVFLNLLTRNLVRPLLEDKVRTASL